MAYDEGLAERVRGLLEERGIVSERKMFGGLAFLIRGHMTVGIVKDELMVRVGPETYRDVLREPHARVMDITGRPMKGFVLVSSQGLESDRDLQRWSSVGWSTPHPFPPRGRKRGPRRQRSGVK
jgi:TfoX/Sxy family transcriptional regulator of competence genes